MYNKLKHVSNSMEVQHDELLTSIGVANNDALAALKKLADNGDIQTIIEVADQFLHNIHQR